MEYELKLIRDELENVYWDVNGFKKRMQYLTTILKKYGYGGHLEVLNTFIQRLCYSKDEYVDINLENLIKELRKL